MRIILLVLAGLCVVGCARGTSPTVEIAPASTSSMGDVSPLEERDASAPVASSVPAGDASAEEFPPLVGSCEAQGFKVLEACPGGVVGAAVGGFDMIEIPELLHYCCSTGPLDASRWDGCFNTLEAAMVCGDKAGIDAANAKIKALVRLHGEPCKTREVRDFWKEKFPLYKRLCALRGFP